MNRLPEFRRLLSYRHIYHAGNFADVLKHLVLARVLRHLTAKDKPLCYFDTHAGSGSYALHSAAARQNREFDSGIGGLWERTELPAAVSDYVDLVRAANPGGALQRYPGSPWFARHLLRQRDRLLLCELHPDDCLRLRRDCEGDRRVRICEGDGFRELLARLPPPERRGLVLIDPPYEIKTDYQAVVDALSGAHRRFATGVYAIWYPVVERARVQQLERRVKASGIRSVQRFELSVRPDSMGQGMTGSGMLVVNPPWTLAAELAQALPWLAEVLGVRDGSGRSGGSYRCETLAGE